MTTALGLTAGVDFFTLLDLLRRAAAHKGLKFHEGTSWVYSSEPIKEYSLDDRLLAVLEGRGIERQPRPGYIFTLVDKDPQEKVPGSRTSDYWNFMPCEGDKSKFDLRVRLGVGLEINLGERGVVFVPQAHGTFTSPTDPLPNLRMFRALVESDDNVLAVAKELAASNGSIVVTWTELGLGGIRRLYDLFFADFAIWNEGLAQFARRNGGVLNPDPNPLYKHPGDELFIAEPAQPQIIKAWRAQLKEYRDRLVA